MNRRSFLKATAGVAGGAAVGGGAIYATTNPASGSVTAQNDIQTTRLTGASDSGIVEDISLWTDGSVWWTGLNNPPAGVRVELSVEHPNGGQGGWQTLARKDFQEVPDETSEDSPYDYERVGGSLFDQTDWETQHFSVPDGRNNKTSFQAQVGTYLLRDDGLGQGTASRHKVVVEVTNEENVSVSLDESFNGEVTMSDTAE